MLNTYGALRYGRIFEERGVYFATIFFWVNESTSHNSPYILYIYFVRDCAVDNLTTSTPKSITANACCGEMPGLIFLVTLVSFLVHKPLGKGLSPWFGVKPTPGFIVPFKDAHCTDYFKSDKKSEDPGQGFMITSSIV